jgi:hypothetical protein
MEFLIEQADHKLTTQERICNLDKRDARLTM